jgi:hypothetical protein
MMKKNALVIGAAAVVVAGLGVSAWLVFFPSPPPLEQIIIKQEAYIPPPPMAAVPAPLSFTDITAQTGITFKHHTGAFLKDGKESRYMPESMGPGVVLFDYDSDGDLDIFVANSSDFPGHTTTKSPTTSHLYRNEGALRFTDVTQAAGLAVASYGMGAAAGDYDGDGHADLLLTTWGGPRLFHNEANGAFKDVTQAAGLVAQGWTDEKGRRAPDWSTGAVFFDADGDGALDLLVINYVEWVPEADIYSTLDGKRKSYSTPELYRGSISRLCLQKDGKFVDVTKDSGVFSNNTLGKSLGIALWDFNQDGRLDIVVANDTQPNFLYENLGGGKFKERGLEAGIAYDENGRTRAGMGIDIADIQNDGAATIAIGNFSKEPVSVFKSVGPGFFREASQQTGVAAPTLPVLTFGLLFADLDLDGWQDLVLANGHIEPHIQDTEAEISYRQPLKLLGNTGKGTFVDWTRSAGRSFQAPLVGRGLAAGDLDGDGDLDLVVTENDGPMHVLRNDAANKHHYLRVQLKGAASNTQAIGARIEVKSGGLTQLRYVRTGSSYLSQSELTQTFGLGNHPRVDQLTVTWPGGRRQTVKVAGTDRVVVVEEQSQKVARGGIR